jgi:hypothetical protein
MTKTCKNKILWITWAMSQGVIRYFLIRIWTSLVYFVMILYLKSRHLNHYFQQMKDFFQKLHTWYRPQNLIIKSFQIVLFNINLSQYYITIESFIHKEHYIKVYWVHWIYLWLDMCICTTLKGHSKLNTKYFTMKF